jgi:hypothetical protein
MENSQTYYRKITWIKNPPYCGFLQAVSIPRWKVFQSPSRAGWSNHKLWESLLGVEVTDRCRKHGNSGQNYWTHNSWMLITTWIRISRETKKLAKIIHQQIVIKYKLLDRSTLPYYRYKPELVLESTNKILYLDRTSITDKTVDFNRSDAVLIDGRTQHHL